MITNDELYRLYQCFLSLGKLDSRYALVFVYNSPDGIDDLHKSECIYPTEYTMIINSFREIFQYTYSYDSEHLFVKSLDRLRLKHKFLLVYSMAQNIHGIGRRTLIPLLCKYYNLISIGSDEYNSFLSGNKYIMHRLLSKDAYFPKTIYFTNPGNYDYSRLESIPLGKYIIKPIDESASIGVEKLEMNSVNELRIFLKEYEKQFHYFCLQEYIEGEEVEVPLLYILDDYYCPGVCKIEYLDNKDYLDYDSVGLDLYRFSKYSQETTSIIKSAITAANKLRFDTISRIDFRIKQSIPYLIDIGANPTISTHSSTNYLFERDFGSKSSVYHLLVIRALIKEGLFKPPFNQPKQYRI